MWLRIVLAAAISQKNGMFRNQSQKILLVPPLNESCQLMLVVDGKRWTIQLLCVIDLPEKARQEPAQISRCPH